ncbi:glycoside hydrolase family 43 protein [Xylariomycetidae sp. FL2044]|nr:glycoside hydrolase family 43 protein [Xylariomycetidae sp. FL2044]
MMRFPRAVPQLAMLWPCLLPYALLVLGESQPPPQFHNSARHAGADPYALYDKPTGQYFVYSTEGADEGWNFAIYSSPDMATWSKLPGGVLKACYDDEMNTLEGGQACWARDWFWAPETFYNNETGWYFFIFAGRLREDLAKDHFRYSEFEEPSKLGIAVSRSPTGPFEEIQSRPIDYYPFDPDYYDVNLIMDAEQMLPPQSLAEGQTAPKGTYIPTIDPNIFFDEDGRLWLYTSRNAYRNWNWDKTLGKYIEESNIIVVELERDWWDDPSATTMPEIAASQRDIHAASAPKLPCDIARYNGTGEIGRPPRKDGWTTVISYEADPQEWENYHVDDYQKYNGTKKDRRWSEASTLLKRPGRSSQSDGGGGDDDDDDATPVYLLLYSANNYEASSYGVGFATGPTPLGPFRKSARNPVLSQKPDAAIPIYSTGHGSVVASPGGDFAAAPASPQEVTLRTPEGAELFYVHHARNDTARDRSLYATRMALDASAMFFGSDDALTMDLTPLDQLLPSGTYPLALQARCPRPGVLGVPGNETQHGAGWFEARVLSWPGAPFDVREGSNRIVGLPGNVEVASIVVGEEQDGGAFWLRFGGNGTSNSPVESLAYQRLSVDGSWVTIAVERLDCA